MRRRPLPFLATATATAIAIIVFGCSAAGAPSPSPVALDGHTYLSTEIEGAELVPGTRVRLSFADGQLNGNAGCNIMGGVYSIDGDRLVTTQMSMTEMGCDEARSRQDEWLARFLSSSVTFALGADTLTLTDGTIRLTLLDEEVATPDQPLEGTRWVLDGIVSGDAVSSVPAGVTAAIQISGGRVDVEAGCNRGGGSVEVTPDALGFGPLVLTKMACDAGPSAVEAAVVAVLTGAVGYTIDADTLTLDADEAGLIFRAAP
jgi:heat shock protein HslJ